MIRKIAFLLITTIFYTSCVSFSSKNKEAPQITEEMPLDEAIQAAIEFGEPTLTQVKKLVKTRQEMDKTEQILTDTLDKNYKSMHVLALTNCIRLYEEMKPKTPEKIASLMIRTDKAANKRIGWQLAAHFPSDKMARIIDDILTKAITENEIESLFFPEMAEAIVSNNMKDAYTLARSGLMTTHHMSFARAMKMLNPEKASSDFLDYLSLAPVEELRQLHLSTVDIMACTEALAHLKNYKAPINHPHFKNIFYYAISRNNGLSELAKLVLEAHMTTDNKAIAHQLIRLPQWIQLAYIESSRSQLTPVSRGFLAEIRKLTASKDIVEEIDELRE